MTTEKFLSGRVTRGSSVLSEQRGRRSEAYLMTVECGHRVMHHAHQSDFWRAHGECWIPTKEDYR
jgi:hypothetical protein